MKYDNVVNFLKENTDVAVDLARELNSWDGSFEEFDTWDLTDLVQCMCSDYKSTQKFVDILLNSLDDLNNTSDWVRFTGYGESIESVDDSDLEEEVLDYIDDIAQGVLDNYPHNISVDNDELRDILDEDDEEK